MTPENEVFGSYEEHFYYFYRQITTQRGGRMGGKTSRFTKTIENGRLRLLPTNKAETTVEQLTPAVKEAARYMIENRFQGILSNA